MPQRKNPTIPENWWQHEGGAFVRAQWQRLGLGCVVGALVATLVLLVTSDSTFAPFFQTKLLALGAATHISGFQDYTPEEATLFAGLFVVIVTPAVLWVHSYVRSWWAGIASMTILLAASTSFLALTCKHRLLLVIGLVLLLALSISVEYLRRHQAGPVSIEPRLVIPAQKTGLPPEQRWEAPISDDPIRNWDGDLIGRASVVELLADHSLHLRAPVVALHGDLGDGKSSVLNLFRSALEGQAIVISFSAWLPGSEATLAADLFRDLTRECGKYVYVPQLRKRARAYAETIGGSVKYLGGLKSLFPAESQREEIRGLREMLSRVPLPIVILLDEIDRMQKEELLVLLKVLRGASSIPNVTFVCAFSEDQVKKELGDISADYLEKFFPVSIRLSPPDPEVVGRCFRARLKSALKGQGWFATKDEAEKFADDLEKASRDSISKICTNFRKAGLLVNSILTTARPIVGEVNALDLALIEAVRRYHPAAYRLIRTNGAVLTYGSGTWTKWELLTADEKEERRNAFLRTLNGAIQEGCPEPVVVETLLSLLFPDYSAAGGERRISYAAVRQTGADLAEDEKRICASDYFPIYFRDAVPENMFSNAELNQMISELEHAKGEEVEAVFLRTLNSFPPKHPEREDFLWKLSRQISVLSDPTAESLAFAVARHASDYSYDIWNVGEAARALAIVFAVAQKLSATPAAQRVLEGAMALASDDTFAIRLLGFTEKKDSNKILSDYSNIDVPAIEDSFIKRMRSRYGRGTDIRAVDITKGDWHAFYRWAGHSNEDREIERNFWRRFIDGSRKRLAQAINFVFPGHIAWSENPVQAVDTMFPIAEFDGLINELPEGENLEEIESKAISRMRDLIAGGYTGPFDQ